MPLLLELYPDVCSVVDVGCGAGVWLARFKERGVERVLGLDGGSAEEHGQLEIKREEYRSADFEHELPADECFDLCLCLEVAEHLTPATATTLVRALCRLSDVIVFSAAIPGQGGLNHLNERWPTYWAGLFAEQNYRPLDCLRGRIWSDARIDWWYRQNLILFVSEKGTRRLSTSGRAAREDSPVDIVHPECFRKYRSELEGQRAVVVALQAQVAQLISENRALSDLQAESTRTREMRSLEAAALNEQLEGQTARLNEILNSASWKLTFPLRRIVGGRRGPRFLLRQLSHFGWRQMTGNLAAMFPKSRRGR